jgi:hypothetical protein
MSCVCADCSSNPLGWSDFHPDPDQDDVVGSHVIPLNDIYDHQLNDEGSCVCRPVFDEEADGLLFIHRSFDGREDIYNRRRKPS